MSTEDQAVLDDAQFESGYTDEATETPPRKEPDPVAVETPPVDPLKELIDRLAKLESTSSTLAGHIGGLTRSQREISDKLAASQAATKLVSDAPTQAQVQAAVGNAEKWANLTDNFPDWAAATEEFVDARIAANKPQAIDPVAIERLVSERIAEGSAKSKQEIVVETLDIVFDDWQDEVKTPAFEAWINGQPDDVKALAASDKIRDAAKMLKRYEAFKKSQSTVQKQSNDSVRQKRIEAAIAPRGTGGHPPGRTADDDFEAGYNS